MKIRLLYLLFILFMFSVLKAQKNKRPVPKKTNVLIILVDDFGWRDIHAYGSDFYETPNMDKLISQGLKFTQSYSTYPRCVPSRYSIMTGSHPARKKGDGEGGERDGESGFSIVTPNISIGQAMKNNGYQTFYVGKWHLGSDDYAPTVVGFDKSIAAGAAGATSSHFAPYNVGRNGKRSLEAAIPDVADATKGECLEDRLTDETIKLLKENSKIQKPFFGILAHYAVHTPIEGKEIYREYFEEKIKNAHLSDSPNYEIELSGETKLKQDNAKYAAMIKSVDDGIGKIINTIKELGLEDNTIIIVTSDHGGLSTRGSNRELATSNKPLRAGKGHLYEGGIRVPLFIKWPKIIKPGIESNSLVQGIDLFPTIMDIIGSKMPEKQIADGESFIDILRGGRANTNRTLFWHNMAPRPNQTGDIYSSVIRSGDYKLIDFYALGKKELYNIKDDIGEKNNLANNSPILVSQLSIKLDEWRKKVGADMKIKTKSLSDAEKKVNAFALND